MNPFAPRSQNPKPRQAVAELLARPDVQVLVIGGGINGIAVFRDLALQGVEVVLVERGDFVSGASSASSHMIHGGIRYLENGEFRLVRESVRERNYLLRDAPHYVKPLETTVPIFSTFSGLVSAPFRFLLHRRGRPTERGALLIKVGLLIYDTFSRAGGTVPRHRFRRREAALADLPHLNPAVKYTATYFDASMHDPERLALDVLHDGLAAGPHARALNYVEAVGAADGEIAVQDTVTGTVFALRPQVVINAGGPWTDLVNESLGDPTNFMGGTKGSHVVLDNPELLSATGGREIFFEHSDGRIVLIYPLKGRVMVGTTDTDADAARPTAATDAEIDYFFDLIAHVFPQIAVDRAQIVYSFSGIRPLPRHEDTSPGFVSRDYRVVQGQVAGMPSLSIVGGKWTTFRALGEHVTDVALRLLGTDRVVSTLGLAIGGGRGYPVSDVARDSWITRHGVDIGRDRAAQLLERYGTRATEVIAAIDEHDRPLATAPSYSRQEIALLARREDVVHLADLVLRRTSLAFTGDAGRDTLVELARIVGAELDWTDARVSAEIKTCLTELAERHGVASAVTS